jgi:hypothetical protein
MRDKNTWRLAGVSALGAVLVEVVLVFSEGLGNAFTIGRIPNHLGAIAVGGLLGWMYELLRELSAATTSSLREISSLTSKIKYQDEALSMLTTCPRHNEVLSELIGASMRDNFRNVPYVGVGEYLQFLGKAIEHSNGYQGIQRQPLGWFKDSAAHSYLEGLRDQKMAYKTRIFVIEEADVGRMEQDLRDPEVLSYYWEHGGEVDSYWLSTEQFKRHCPRLRVPDDFALYDGTLLIAYDTGHQVLTFNLVDESSHERQIFAAQQNLASHGVDAFKRIPKEPVQRS